MKHFVVVPVAQCMAPLMDGTTTTPTPGHHYLKNPALSRENSTQYTKNGDVVSIPCGIYDGPPRKWTWWETVLSYHRYFALRHIIVLILMIAITCFGGWLFVFCEADAEKRIVPETRDILLNIISNSSLKLRDMAAANESLNAEIKKTLIALMNVEQRYGWSTFDKVAGYDNGERKYMHSFWNCYFFVISLFTTIGYGAIAPVTVVGKAFLMIYGTLTIPATQAVVRDYAQWFLILMTKVYAHILIGIRSLRGKPMGDRDRITMSFLLCFFIVALFYVAVGFIVYFWDDGHGKPGSGLDVFHSINFAFISMSTLGFGDIMPNNVPFDAVLMSIFFFGMPMTRIVNRRYYLAFENLLYGATEALHVKIDRHLGLIPPVEQPVHAEDDTSSETEEEKEARIRNEHINNFSIRSIPSLLRGRADVCQADFGRVTVKKADL